MPDYDDYQLEEYSNIAQAHFKTSELISSFFKYALVVMSAPLSILPIVFSSIKDSGLSKATLETLQTYFMGPVFLTIALVGFFIIMYIVNLRFDALLYARQVNSIRKYFQERSKVPIRPAFQGRVLPTDVSSPPFFEAFYFLPVVILFAIVGSLYCFLGISFIRGGVMEIVGPVDSTQVILSLDQAPVFNNIILATVFFLAHITMYRALSYMRENDGSLITRKMVIGVDIDGVLNNHRDVFCNMLNAKNGTGVKPSEISLIPVHKCTTLGISKDQEVEVFNDPAYWSDMTPMVSAAETLNKIKMSHNMNVWAFTHRPWPKVEGMNSHTQSKTLNEWDDRISKDYRSCLPRCVLERMILWVAPIIKCLKVGWLFRRKGCHARALTKRWLTFHQFPIDRLFVETRRDEIFSRHKPAYNRIFKAKLNPRVQFFVEDDLVNAIKLSDHCELVFLINHPYNQSLAPYDELKTHGKELPKNVIRVNSWGEIHGILSGFL
mgnify:CR=1 FL=1